MGDLSEMMTQSNISAALVGGFALWIWLRLGRRLTGQNQFPHQWSGLAGTGATSKFQRVIAPLSHLVLCLLGALVLALVQARRHPLDVADAALIGILVGAFPISGLALEGIWTRRFRALAPGYLVLLAGLVVSSVLVYATRSI